jgi:hypothetical protein
MPLFFLQEGGESLIRFPVVETLPWTIVQPFLNLEDHPITH